MRSPKGRSASPGTRPGVASSGQPRGEGQIDLGGLKRRGGSGRNGQQRAVGTTLGISRGWSSYALRSGASYRNRCLEEEDTVTASIVTATRQAIVTADPAVERSTADRIVTALATGPATALELSQRLSDVGYANIRQTLRRLANSGRAEKLQRGVYAVPANPVRPSAPSAPASSRNKPCGLTPEVIRWAVLSAFADYYATDDPVDPRAWAR